MMTQRNTEQIEQIELTRLVPYARNSRTHSDEQVAGIMASIREFGFCNPVLVDEENTIIAGHGRVLAAQRMEMKTVPCRVIGHLTDAQRRAYVIADNRLALNAGWDRELLENEITDLHADEIDLKLLGFEPDELDDLLGIKTDTNDIVEDEVPEPPAVPVTQPGDLWLLGEHRLLCGDSTKRTDVESVMAGDMAAAVLTDPPYGVDYVGKTKDAMVVENDSAAGLHPLLTGALEIACEFCREGGAWYVAAPPGPQFADFASVLGNLGIWRQTLVWVKDSLVMGRSDYHYRHESIFYGWKPGKAHKAPPDRKQTTVWEFDRPKASREHPTMKPVALYAKMLENSTAVGSVIYEPFCGSGTTLIAAEQLNRNCYGMEISPQYCDVIIQRWEKLTGNTAVKGG